MRINKKKLMIYISIILVFILVIICIFIKKNKSEVNDFGNPDEIALSEESELTNIDSAIKRVSIRNNFYYIENSMNKYFSLLNINNIENNVLEELKENLYSLIGEEYIEENNITKDNILDYFEKNNNATFFITDMFVTQRSFDISVYFIYGVKRENGVNSQFSVMIYADRTNETFKVYPSDYMKKYQNIDEGNNINIDVPEHINNDGYNTFEYKNISNDMHAEELFEDLKNYLLYDNETLYERLEDEYKKQFSNYQDFYDFISSNYLKLIRIKYNGYNKLNEENMTATYLLKDEDGNFEFKIYEIDPFYYKVTINVK